MNLLIFLPLLAIVIALRVLIYRRRRATRSAAADSGPASTGGSSGVSGGPKQARAMLGSWLGDVGLVAEREVRERVRGRILRVGTLLILLVVAAAIIIPVLDRGRPNVEHVGVVGHLSAPLQAVVVSTGTKLGYTVHLVPEANAATADRDLRSGRVDLVIVDARELLVNKAIAADDTSTTALVAHALSDTLGVDEAVETAGLSPAQVEHLADAKPLPVASLQGTADQGGAHPTSIIGLILVFVMLQQYTSWILLGVMEEKSSRVVEVLLAAVRPVQLLGGKVLGIGLVAFAQAGVIVAFALVLAKAVGSDLLKGTGPMALVSTLVWLLLGYAFYCWVYAAAGSMAERQEQVQSLAFPLIIPALVGYIVSITVAASGNPTTFFDVLAYLPPTAPFAMPVLVGLGRATWWEFAASAGLSIVCTVAVARLAAGIYRRAILRTGRRVRIREVFARVGR
ncbi:MAG: ABC transporter permease [Acidimicrobiales bacterium]